MGWGTDSYRKNGVFNDAAGVNVRRRRLNARVPLFGGGKLFGGFFDSDADGPTVLTMNGTVAVCRRTMTARARQESAFLDTGEPRYKKKTATLSMATASPLAFRIPTYTARPSFGMTVINGVTENVGEQAHR